MKRFIYILMLMISAAACSEKADIGTGTMPQKTMRINSMVKSGSQPDFDSYPVYLFWFSSEYGRITSPAEDVQPYFACYPQHEIDTVNVFDTGRPYPPYYIYAYGYCPASLISDKSKGYTDWSKLYVPEEEQGYHDILVAKRFISGAVYSNVYQPLDRDGVEMVFEHAQSKVNFYAFLSESSASGRYFRNVTVKVPVKGQLTSELSWDINSSDDLTDDRYRASAISESEGYWCAADPNTNQMDPAETTDRNIGSVFIHPGMNSLDIVVEVEVSNSPLFDKGTEIVAAEISVPFISDAVHHTLKEGQAFDVIIEILYDSFVIKGNKALWQEGGKIPIPIYPNR